MSTPAHDVQTRRVTGADIPLELFPDIIQGLAPAEYYNPDSHLPNKWISAHVRNCSLVCLDWAHPCRQILFGGRTLRVTSKKQAVGLRDLVMASGSDRLTPIAKLIGGVRPELDPRDRNWLHILHATIPVIPSSAFTWLKLDGKHPSSSTSAPVTRLMSPYWGLPRRFCTPPYRKLELRNVHFTSLSDISQFLNHFPLVEEFDFYEVIWANKTPPLAAAPRFLHSAQRRRVEISLYNCQSSGRLLLQVLDRGRISVLQTLQHVDREAAVNIIKSVSAARDDDQSNRFIECEFTSKQISIGRAAFPDTICTESDHHPRISATFWQDGGAITELYFVCKGQHPLSPAGEASQVAGLAIFCSRIRKEGPHGLEAMKSLLKACGLDKALSFIPGFSALRGLIVGVEADPNDEVCVTALAEIFNELLQSLSPMQLKYHRLCMYNSPSKNWMAIDPSSRKRTGASKFVLCWSHASVQPG